MPYLVETHHRPDNEETRNNLRPEHLAYLDANVSKLLAAGAKLNDDGSVAPGSFYIVDTEDRAAAEAFMNGEPYSRAGLFERVVYTRWRKGYFDFKRQPAK
jgi:uncharacterized protein YciI